MNLDDWQEAWEIFCFGNEDPEKLAFEMVILTVTDGQLVPAHILTRPLVTRSVAAFLIHP